MGGGKVWIGVVFIFFLNTSFLGRSGGKNLHHHFARSELGVPPQLAEAKTTELGWDPDGVRKSRNAPHVEDKC